VDLVGFHAVAVDGEAGDAWRAGRLEGHTDGAAALGAACVGGGCVFARVDVAPDFEKDPLGRRGRSLA
jgi:hypothetical protein